MIKVQIRKDPISIRGMRQIRWEVGGVGKSAWGNHATSCPCGKIEREIKQGDCYLLEGYARK